MKCGPYIIDEASLSRAYQHVVQKKSPRWGMVTAFRVEFSKKQNEKRNKELEKDIRGMGYGYFKVEGHWKSCKDQSVSYDKCPEEQLVDSIETSLFVPNIKSHEIDKLGKKYNQDAVIYGDTNSDAHLLFKNGDTQNIGKFHPGKVTDAYSKIKGGTFIFEPEDSSIQKPKEQPAEKPKSEPVKLKSLLPKDILNKTIKNPKTGNNIKVGSALKYDKQSPVFQIAAQMLKRKVAESYGKGKKGTH